MSGLRDERFARSTLRWAVGLIAAAAGVGMFSRAVAGEALDKGSIVGVAVLLLCAVVVGIAKKHLHAAAYVLTSFSWLAASAISAARGPTYAAMIPLYLLIVLIAGLILGVRVAAVFGVLSCAAVGALVVAQDTGILPMPPPPSTLYRAMSAIMVTGGITAVFSIAVSRMGHLVTELRDARADLERTVDARTRSLTEARDAAQAASRAKSAFIANVSHELRTPLNAVVGMSEALLQTPLSPAQHAQADALRRGADALTAVVNDVLDLATLEAGVLTVERTAFDPQAVLNDVLALMSPEAARRKLNLDTDIKPLPSQVLGDARRLRQILLNLVGNALKFTDSGSVTLRAAHTGDALHFTVQDTGPGIAPSFLPRIFEPFARADGTKPGLGLGLPIARELTVRLGGTLEASSAHGAGALFELRVPAAVAAPDPPTPPPGPRITTPLKILVAEDNELNVQVLVALLRALGQDATLARDGHEALAAVRRDAFDIVLMDVQMPGLDGVEATRIMQHELGANAPCVIGVTADAQADKVRLFRDAGMCDVLHKPLHLESLARALARAPVAERNGP